MRIAAALPRLRSETKIALVLRADLPVWQQVNMAAFLISGIAATADGVVGEPYEDASGVRYLPMFRQPVLVFAATAEELRSAYEHARARKLPFAIFTDELFTTGRQAVDAVVKGLPLHE